MQKERLSDRIMRYQSRDGSSVDVNGIVFEVQQLERELQDALAEVRRLQASSGGITWMHCNACYAIGAKLTTGIRWTQSLAKCDHHDVFTLTGHLVQDVPQRIEQAARIHAAEAMVKMHTDMRKNLMSKFFSLAARAEAKSCSSPPINAD